MGYGKEKENASNQKLEADLWIKIWEELHRLAARDTVVEVEHVKAHRTKKMMRKRFRTLSGLSLKNEKADELESRSSVGRRIYGGSESKDNAARKRRGVCRSAVRSQLSPFWWRTGKNVKSSSRSHRKSGISWNRKERRRSIERSGVLKPRRYRCMRCGRGSKCMEMPGKCTEPKYLSFFLGRGEKMEEGVTLEGHDLVRRVDRQEEVLIWCMKCSGYARQRMGPTLMKCCRSEQVSTKEHGKILKRIQILEDGRVPAKEAKK